MLNKIRILALLLTTLITGCATAPSGMTFDSPVGQWSGWYETPLGSKTSSEITVIDETRATYPGGRIEFYAIDEQRRWKGYWIGGSGSNQCIEEKDGSLDWGELIHQFNETYNQYTGTWDYCGEGQQYAVKGAR